MGKIRQFISDCSGVLGVMLGMIKSDAREAGIMRIVKSGLVMFIMLGGYYLVVHYLGLCLPPFCFGG